MELTGKAKKDFKKWLINKRLSLVWKPKYEHQAFIIPLAEYFEGLSESMQYGVYVDWFDSVNIMIKVSPLDFPLTNSFWMNVDSGIVKYYKTRPEARTEAIKKANEIYNR